MTFGSLPLSECRMSRPKARERKAIGKWTNAGWTGLLGGVSIARSQCRGGLYVHTPLCLILLNWIDDL